MKAVDFNYNGILASDSGVMICRFDSSSGFETVGHGSQISFNTTPLQNGNKFALTSAMYDECAEYTFQVCKFACGSDIMPFTIDEQRKIYRWLNRKDGYFPLRIIQDGYENIYFEGSFNILAIEWEGLVFGYELTFITDRPFALHDMVKFNISITDTQKTYSIYDISDEIGCIYPNIKITCLESGTLKIHNGAEDRTTIIDNCSVGEVITIDKYLNVSTSLDSHKIQNDFNFIYLRIANAFKNRKNLLTFSIKCNVKIEYNPIVKGVGL